MGRLGDEESVAALLEQLAHLWKSETIDPWRLPGFNGIKSVESEGESEQAPDEVVTIEDLEDPERQ